MIFTPTKTGGPLHGYDLANGVETEIGRVPAQPKVLVLTADGELAITGDYAGGVTAWPLHGGRSRVLVRPGGRLSPGRGL